MQGEFSLTHEFFVQAPPGAVKKTGREETARDPSVTERYKTQPHL